MYKVNRPSLQHLKDMSIGRQLGRNVLPENLDERHSDHFKLETTSFEEEQEDSELNHQRTKAGLERRMGGKSLLKMAPMRRIIPNVEASDMPASERLDGLQTLAAEKQGCIAR